MKHLLEIESKFHFSPSLLPRFLANQGSPPFQHLAFIRTRKFQDTYYDYRGILQRNGLWVRERGDVSGGDGDGDGDGRVEGEKTIQAKHLLSGTYTRSTFAELTDLTSIRAQILHYLPPNHPINTTAPNFGLDILAQLTTTRQTFLADEKFTLVLDQTDFGHSVGEVEVEVKVEAEVEGKEGGNDAKKVEAEAEKEAEQAERAHRDIDAFLAKYEWFFGQRGRGPVEGKLSAYERLKGWGRGGEEEEVKNFL